MKETNQDVHFISVLTFMLTLVTLSVGLVLFPGCADDPLFNQNPPPAYIWNPGKSYADSVSYLDNDSITLYGHFQPKAFVVTVKEFSIEVSEVEGEAIKKIDIYPIQKDVIWSFNPDNLYDTLILAKWKIPRIDPKPNITNRFRVYTTVVTPPGYATPTFKVESNSVNILATGAN